MINEILILLINGERAAAEQFKYGALLPTTSLSIFLRIFPKYL